jgi:hypothetical protein
LINNSNLNNLNFGNIQNNPPSGNNLQNQNNNGFRQNNSNINVTNQSTGIPGNNLVVPNLGNQMASSNMNTEYYKNW